MAGTDQDQDHDDAAASLTEMKYLKRQGNSSDEAAAKSLYLARPVLALPATSSPNIDAGAHIKVYSYYVIDHSKLPFIAPHQLKSIRVVMVSEKCRNRVGVRFPSMCSLRAHFNGGECGIPGKKTKMMPSMDEKYVMEPEVAGEVLYRRIPPHEIGENRNLWSFWVVCADVEVVPKVGLCLSVMKSDAGMLKWGKKKKVKFLGRYEEEGKKNELPLLEYVRTENSNDEEEDVKSDALKKDRKRKSHVSAICGKPKRDKKKMKIMKSSSGRWSKERYTLAEVNMLKILKEQGAVFGRPIMRPALRTEARKLIGDTGLLDHLLKHMAGKVAPGGQERFRRRHNADGAMEYWLESADLVNIRKEAGVQDPYWTPPPGWTPGDNPTQDPVCAREIRQLKQDLAKLSRDLQVLLSKKQEDDMAIVTTPTSCITSQTLEHNSFLHPLKEMYTDLVNKKVKIEEQLTEISHSLSGMEQEIEKLESLDIDKTGSKTTQTAPEGKAAKIERLKSGFRICKPQGTFLWPNMVMSPPATAVVPLDDLLVASTPPSASSSTTPTPPIKPLAEKLLPAATQLTSTKPSDPCLLINLNELPTNQDELKNLPCHF